jgi:hypothetical protein
MGGPWRILGTAEIHFDGESGVLCASAVSIAPFGLSGGLGHEVLP